MTGKPPFAVASHRSTRIANGGICDACRMSCAPLWRYAESSLRRPVQICTECKTKMLDYSFGHRDLLDTPLCKPSPIEVKRSRH